MQYCSVMKYSSVHEIQYRTVQWSRVQYMPCCTIQCTVVHTIQCNEVEFSAAQYTAAHRSANNPPSIWTPVFASGGKDRYLRRFPACGVLTNCLLIQGKCFCSAVQCSEVYSTVQCIAVMWCVLQCIEVHCSVLNYTTLQCSVVLHNAVQCSVMQFKAVKCNALQCCAV